MTKDPSSTLSVEPLNNAHQRQAFNCGKPRLNAYISLLALQHQKRHIGRTFVLVRHADPQVLGFYTLVASSVAFQHLPATEKFPKYPVPVIKLAQLAVDVSVRGHGWGKFLLFDALARAERISHEIAVYGIELDAIDEEARIFDLQYSFVQLQDDVNHLYLPLRHLAKWGLMTS